MTARRRKMLKAMDNYAIATQAAARRFCTYDMERLARKNGVTDGGEFLCTCFLGQAVQINKRTGLITFPDGREADFCEALTVYDWLCDRKDSARAAWEFCPVGSLPGVYVSGGTLGMTGGSLPAKIDQAPRRFLEKCTDLGAKSVEIGDIGMEFMAFPDLPVRLKFYHADEEFPASLTLLWDKNILDFIRYETVYYLAACLLKMLG